MSRAKEAELATREAPLPVRSRGCASVILAASFRALCGSRRAQRADRPSCWGPARQQPSSNKRGTAGHNGAPGLF